MSRLDIRLDQGKLTYAPGEELVGTVAWQLETVPESLSLRLFWATSGKAEAEVSLVETVPIEGAGMVGEREFRCRLPAGPLSFSGQLISLSWALELVAEPGSHTRRLEILLSEIGREIRLPRLDPPARARKKLPV